MNHSERQRECLERIGIDTWSLRNPAPESSVAAMMAPVAGVPARAPGSSGENAPIWEELRTRVAQCVQCELHKGRTQTVFGVGNESAGWMLIGEAPGAEEDRQGEPFVGRAGQLLNSMLAAMGLKRGDVYIANTVKCRPTANRNPRPEEAAACAGYLLRQIELIQPRIILALGAIAAHYLLNVDTPVGKMRGRVYQHPSLNIPVVVTYHPAYLLRSPSEKRRSWDDLQFAMKVFRGES